MTHKKDEALAAPVQDEFPLRGILASELKCWHRLTEDEQINLLAFVKNTRPAAQPATEEYSETQTASEYVKTYHGGKPWPLQPAPVQELHKENPYYPATHIGEGWQDGFDGKEPASTLEPYTRGYAEGKEDSHAIKKGQPLIDLRQDAWNKINSPEQVAALDKTIVDFASGTKGQS